MTIARDGNRATPSRVAVVTGASRGIGAATALELARRGWDLCVGYVRDVDAAEAVVSGCRDLGRHARAIQGDVGRGEDIVRLFEAADEVGPLDVLVNNAAYLPPPTLLDALDDADVHRIFAVNAIGPLLCAREAARRMRARGGGLIVNVSSIGARTGAPNGHVNYAATKGALESMTIGLAKELAPHGIRVNAVRPGAVDTEMQTIAGDEAHAASKASEAPIGRAGRPEEIAQTIAWLCSDESSFVVGAVIDVTGGR